mmetsp:Transcript_11642/g.41547  ORF Transcript_11642/g.41547 Transcript_11642/m.41547 type:complete len:434 (-) Transcript_11642:3438-4739(-)
MLLGNGSDSALGRTRQHLPDPPPPLRNGRPPAQGAELGQAYSLTLRSRRCHPPEFPLAGIVPPEAHCLCPREAAGGHAHMTAPLPNCDPSSQRRAPQARHPPQRGQALQGGFPLAPGQVHRPEAERELGGGLDNLHVDLLHHEARRVLQNDMPVPMECASDHELRLAAVPAFLGGAAAVGLREAHVPSGEDEAEEYERILVATLASDPDDGLPPLHEAGPSLQDQAPLHECGAQCQVVHHNVPLPTGAHGGVPTLQHRGRDAQGDLGVGDGAPEAEELFLGTAAVADGCTGKSLEDVAAAGHVQPQPEPPVPHRGPQRQPHAQRLLMRLGLAPSGQGGGQGVGAALGVELALVRQEEAPEVEELLQGQAVHTSQSDAHDVAIPAPPNRPAMPPSQARAPRRQATVAARALDNEAHLLLQRGPPNPGVNGGSQP